MKQIPNAYGASIVTVEPLTHPSGRTWLRATWDYQGKRYSANAVPGSTANRQVEQHPTDKPARIILNGRNQIILVDEMEA